ncbi:MAG: glycosyltransferase family 2 protein, partial [Actinobacteria bacterium]|nr:glycosyltransferase family 2 protein [Actinomycetota bacterium]
MDYLEACLGSVAAQQNVDVEHLIFDPGSTDGSREFAAAHAARYPFVQYFGEPDTGQADAINKGLEMASGDILSWLNSDDSYVGPAVLERVVAEFEANPDVDVVCGRGTYITPEGKLIKEAWVHRDGAVIPDRLRKSIGLFQPSVFFRRRVYEKVGGLDTAYDLSLDYDYWIRFAQAGMNFHFLDEVLAKMTIHRDSKTVGSRGAQFDEYLEMLQKHYGRPDPVWIDRAALHRATGRDGMLETSRHMTFSQAARYRFHHSLLRRRHLPETPRLESAVVATTFDASYYEQGLNLIAGLHRTSMDSVDQIVVFDLGLESEQRDHLSGYDRVTVVDYPSEVDGLFDGYMNPKNYSYKCAAIKAAGEFVDDGGVVVFMDAGITPLRPIREIVERTRTNGVFFVDHGDLQTWPIYNIQFTHENSLAAMGATVEEAMGEHLCSCLIGYTKGGPFQSLINEAYEYSKDPTIVVAPKHLAPDARIEARVGNDARMLRKEILEAPSDHSSINRDELRALFGYFGHRQDQSIYSVLAARYGAEQQPASRYNSSNSQSSRVSKLNWESGSLSAEISVSRTNLDSTDDGTVIYHHRGTFSNLDGLQHDSRTSDCLFLLGNGPSLASIDLRSLEGVDSMGFNAAYRHWREIDWYPTYYACLDTVVTLSHADEIADMVHSADKNRIRRFFLREKILEARPELENNPLVMFFERESGRRSGLGARPLTTGSHSLLWAWLLGYTRIFMLGVDLNYVEVIDGAKMDADSTLSIESDIDHNPNYFFPGYQTKGDHYNIANPEPNLHYDSWVAAAKTLPGNVDVFNLNPNSAVDIFETMDFETALQEAQVTRRSVFRTFDPPARATGVEGL